MKRKSIFGLSFLLLYSISSWSSEALPRYRVDCRFYGNDRHPKFCYASAIYNLKGNELLNIQFGVGCDYETIFNDKGISTPQESVSDGIRPRNAATPKIELVPAHSLRNSGTYAAKLELPTQKLTEGVCYVSEVEGHGPYWVLDQYFDN